MVSSLQAAKTAQASITVGNVSGTLINEHTVSIRFLSTEITMTDVLNSEELIEALVPQGTFYVLAEMPNVRKTAPETRRHIPHPQTRAIAVIYANPVGRMLGNVFLRLKGSALQTRLFGERGKALQWFEELGPPST